MYLEIDKVVKQYAGHRALDGVSLSVSENTIYGLLGPNGAGKTTLIRIINCITAPDSGAVLLNGKCIEPSDMVRVGYLPEERGLYKKMKVGEQALYLARLKGMSKNDAIKSLKQWFEKFEIETWWNKKVEELSKGMAQKVQFITTILHHPSLLIFDEPFSGFDPVNADLIKQEILELHKNGATIIFSTHNMATVEDLCENISLVDQSRIVLQGNVREIRNSFATKNYSVQTTEEIHQNDKIEIISQIFDKGFYQSKLRKEAAISNNEFILEISKQANIISFEQLIPGMSEIFIDTVKRVKMQSI